MGAAFVMHIILRLVSRYASKEVNQLVDLKPTTGEIVKSKAEPTENTGIQKNNFTQYNRLSETRFLKN